MLPDLMHDISDDVKAMIGQVLAVNEIDATSITAIWTHEISLQGIKGVLAIIQCDPAQTVAVLNVPVVVMPIYGKILSWGDVMQLSTVISEIPSAQYAIKDNVLFFTLCLPLNLVKQENIRDIFESLLKGTDTVRTNLLAAIRHLYDIKQPEEVSYPEPVLPNIKMTPKEMQFIYAILKRCNGPVQEIYTLLMEKWVKAGYIVETTSTAIVLDIPYGTKTTRLAMLMPGVSEGLAALQPAGRAYPPSLILFWESLRKRQGFQTESIDDYQRVVKEITTLHITESSAHIDLGDQFDMQAATALVKAMKSLAKSIGPELVEAPGTSGPVTPDNIELTLAACPEHVQAIYRKLVQDWKVAGGTVQCARPGRIYLKLKTKAHRSGRMAQFSRNFNLAVLAGPRGQKTANMQIGWDLSSAAYGAYLDCIPSEVARFEEVVTSLPGFERKGTITYIWVDEKFQPVNSKLLISAMIDLKKAEQAAL